MDLNFWAFEVISATYARFWRPMPFKIGEKTVIFKGIQLLLFHKFK